MDRQIRFDGKVIPMNILRSLFFLGFLFILVCLLGNQSLTWGEESQKEEEILSDQELLETVCFFATVPLEKVVTSEIEKNAEVYLTSSPEIGLYFIERNITILEQLQAQEVGLVSQSGWKWDLAFSYGWYGKTLRKIGKTEEAQSYLVKALKVSQDAGSKFTSQEELLEFLERLKKSHLKHRPSKNSKTMHPFSSSQKTMR